MESILSAGQKKIVAAAITGFCILVLIVLFVGSFILLQKFMNVFSSVLWPVVIALIMSLLLKPLVQKIEDRTKFSRNNAIILIYVLTFVICTSVSLALIPTILTQGKQFVKYVPKLVQKVDVTITKHAPQLTDIVGPYIQEFKDGEVSDDLIKKVQNGITKSAPWLKHGISSIMKFFTLLSIGAIVPIYLFYLLETDRNLFSDLKKQMLFLPKKVREDIVYLIEEFIRILVLFFRGQLIIGLIMGVLLATGFSISGLQFAVIIGLLVGILNVIPYLGTIIGILMVFPLAYFQHDGGWMTVGFCAITFVLVQIIEGYVLTPKIMGKQTGLHPGVLIFAILFWGTAMDGLLGMILAIPLTAFLITAWHLIQKKYLFAIANSNNNELAQT